MNRVKVGNKVVSFANEDVIGQGGEGVVFKYGNLAVKVYLNPTVQRAQKLEYLLQKNWSLPKGKVVLPVDLVKDMSDNVVGLVMPFLGHGYEEVSSLSNKRFRNAHHITPEKIVRLFIDGAHTLQAIHNEGIVVGDLNSKNELFRAYDMIYLEPDGMQVDRFPCLVATEQFVVPELYGVNFANQKNGLVFKDNYDWYSFAVMLFQSLLMTHPYGGVYRAMPRLTQRALKKITVFHPDVIYPKIAQDPSILTSDMRNVFDEYFKNGWRGPFPMVILEDYLSHITGRPVVTRTYTVPLQEAVSKDGVLAREIITTAGNIIFTKVIGDTFYCIAVEDEYIYLHSYSLQKGNEKLALFKAEEVVGAKYEIFLNYLALNVPGNEKILIFEITNSGISLLTTTSASEFSITQKLMFKASSTHFYRIVGGSLMEGSIQYGSLVERTLRTVNNKQTWFTVNPYHQGINPQMFGFFQVLSSQLYWYAHEGSYYDVNLPSLNTGEILRDISVRFSSQGAMIRRLTSKSGVDYVRIEILNQLGEVIFQKQEKQDDYDLSMHGMAYTTGKALHATDEGIVQEDLLGNSTKVFEKTRDYLAAGFVLEKFGTGLAVVANQQVVLLDLQ